MRVKFRILLYKGDKRLRKKDLEGIREPFWIGVRYITEFKYLEATKWLLVAEDSYEKYLLLSLVHLSLGQEETAKEFAREAASKPKSGVLKVKVLNPEGKEIEGEKFLSLNSLL